MLRWRWIGMLGAGLLIGILAGCSAGPATPFLWGEVGSVKLVRSGRIDFEAINESSGLVASRRHAGVFWTLNDSGDSARIFAVGRRGEIILSAGVDEADYDGIAVRGAKNVDWEAIAIDGAGNLVIGAFGNNSNARADLSLYVVPEPDPWTQTRTEPVQRRVEFRYPDQDAFPPPDEAREFDCEALFIVGEYAYVLTKHRGDRWDHTKLYRAHLHPEEALAQEAELIARAPVDGQVTAADITPDGTRLAVLTYGVVWVFEGSPEAEDWLVRPVWRQAIRADQCEAIAWDGLERLIITNEQRDIFELQLFELQAVGAAAAVGDRS